MNCRDRIDRNRYVCEIIRILLTPYRYTRKSTPPLNGSTQHEMHLPLPLTTTLLSSEETDRKKCLGVVRAAAALQQPLPPCPNAHTYYSVCTFFYSP